MRLSASVDRAKIPALPLAAGAIVAVQQDDFVGFAAVDLARVAHADHVLGEFAAVVVTHAHLAHHERLEPFAAQFI